jgi:hypothetical protein
MRDPLIMFQSAAMLGRTLRREGPGPHPIDTRVQCWGTWGEGTTGWDARIYTHIHTHARTHTHTHARTHARTHAHAQPHSRTHKQGSGT